jgi:HAD superfamily hydrolase (TIGR01509 family)
MNLQTKPITTLLFDWDGTLADSAQLGLIAFQESFARMDIQFHQPTYEASYSPNWYSIYEAMGVPRDKWNLADELWIKYYGEQTAALVPGAAEAISELHHRGYVLGIVSSGSDCRVTRELDQLGLRRFFRTVVCNEHMTNKKPHREGLDIAMRHLNGAPKQSCYVGDSPEDIEMGRNAEVLTVGVRSSYPTSWKLQSANPDIYLESVSQLLSHFTA